MVAQGSRGSAATQPLKFFKNYFVTGDYVVAGVGLWGRGVNGVATGSITIGGVPTDAEVLAAFLYFQVVTSDGPETGAGRATFNGHLLSVPGPPAIPTPGGTLAAIGNPFGTSPCWSEGGGTGSSGGSKKTYLYRVDVKRFLPIGSDGRHFVNRAHTVQLPDTGNSNSTPKALGASLVVIYRDPSPTAKLNAIVIYDGSYTLNNSTRRMSQEIAGFYDPAAVNGKITHIVGSAQANKSERLLAPGVDEYNAFQGFDGAAWDTVTRATTPVKSDTFITSVESQGLGSFDCLNWGAIVYRTQVNDGDGDGLLDRWESSRTTLYDPDGNALPNLAAMNASKDHKDVFIEIGYMKTGETSYGGVTKRAHTHALTHAAITKVGEMFRDAPVSNPDRTTGINVHIDLGDTFPSGSGDPYLVRGSGARGGEWFDESITQCVRGADAPPWICQFSGYPGTVGWKSGFRYLRDKPLTMPDEACDAAESDDSPLTTCERVFDRNRKDMFRYVLFVHAIGLPKEKCLVNDRSRADFGFPNVACQTNDPLFHVPVTNTGVADFPGGDAMVALGGFDDGSGRPVGTDYMQAATLVHELGHTFQLRHGGAKTEPNCKPNYLSVMNYLFQLRGLRRNSGPPAVDFSAQQFGTLREESLSDPGGLGTDLVTSTPPSYRTGWYALPGPGVLGTPSLKHCDGTPLRKNANGTLAEPSMVRVDSASVEDTITQIDWTLSSTTQPPLQGQDLNFDGVIGPLNASFNDWENIRLNQLGSRRNIGTWFWVYDADTENYGAFIGPLSVDTSRLDFGPADMGLPDMGSGDLLQGDLGRGDLNLGDLGRNNLGLPDMGLPDMGLPDMGLPDMGSGDIGLGDSGLGDSADGELTTDLIAAHGFAPPNELTAVVVGLANNCAGLTPATCHRIKLDWSRTNLASEFAYRVFRVDRPSIAAGTLAEIGLIPAVSGQSAYTFTDMTELPNGVFTYIVTAEFVGGLSASDVRITAINAAPLAVNDPTTGSYSVIADNQLSVAAPGVLRNDADIDSPSLRAASVVPLNTDGSFLSVNGGTVRLNLDGSFTYIPAGNYTGTDTFSYVVRDADPSRTSNSGTVSISVEHGKPPKRR